MTVADEMSTYAIPKTTPRAATMTVADEMSTYAIPKTTQVRGNDSCR